MNVTQFLAILRARWLSAVLVLALTLGTAIAVTLVLPKGYTAQASVVLDIRSPDPLLGMMMGSMNPSYVSTQVDIIQSERVAQRVVQQLKLADNPQSRQSWFKATGGNGDYEAWLALGLKSKLSVKPSRDSNVVTVAYTSPDPKAAATLANAFVKAYIEVSLGLRVSPAKQNNEFFDARSKELREALEAAQAKLTEFQKTSGILATDERFDIESQRLNELNSQLVVFQAQAVESSSRKAQASNQVDQLQEVINNPVVAGLRSDISRQEARLQEFNAKFGDAHPQVVELRANIAELRQRIERESARVGGSVGVANTINRQREAEVRSALNAQRAKVMALKQQRDEAAVLMKEVDTAQRIYDQVVARASQTSIESQNTQTNVSLLTAASEPAEPSSPKILINGAIGLLAGIVLALGVALVRELLDRRVRTAQDLTELLGVPMLGVLPKPMRAGLLGRNPKMVLPGNMLTRLPSARG